MPSFYGIVHEVPRQEPGEKNGQWQRALHLFHLIPLVNLTPDNISLTRVISSCEKGGEWLSALQLFRHLPVATLTPDVILGSWAGKSFKFLVSQSRSSAASLLLGDPMRRATEDQLQCCN